MLSGLPVGYVRQGNKKDEFKGARDGKAFGGSSRRYDGSSWNK
jgi:hypothetical protein